MSEEIALKNLLKVGIVLMVSGFAVTVTGLFSYIDEASFFNIVVMSSGVIFTSLGYAFSSLYFYRNRDCHKRENHKNCISFH